MLKEFVASLRAAGHVVEHASMTVGAGRALYEPEAGRQEWRGW